MDETEALKAMGYVDIESSGLHVSEKDAQMARNDKLVREWEILKTFAKATKDKEFYLNWGQTVSGRYTIMNDINYQESKLHREFVVAEGSTELVDVNDADSRQMLEASILQGLDMDPDKLSAETATKNFNKVFKVTDKGIEVAEDGAIKQAYEALRDGKVNAEAMAEVFADSEGHHGISSIELLVDWDKAIKDGTKVETHANLEIDAITSGMILTLLQIGSDQALRLAEKGGIYTEARKPELEAYVNKWLGKVEFTPGALIEAGKKHAAEIEEKMKTAKGAELAKLREELESDDTFKDLYSTIGVAMIGEVQAYKTKLENIAEPSNSEVQQLAMLNQIGELNLKNIRSIAKSPVMVYIYGATTSSIKKKLTYSLGVDTLVKAIKTASKKLKAGEEAKDELEFIKMYVPEEKYINEFGAKIEKPAEVWEQLLALDIQPSVDTIDKVINATFGTAIETAFESRLGFVDKNRDAAKSIEVLLFEAYQIRLADEVEKFLDMKYGVDRHNGETYKLSKQDMQMINVKLTEDGYGHNIVWYEDGETINQSLNKTGDKGGKYSTNVTVGDTKVGGQIKEFKPAVNTGAAPTISIHAIDGRMMLDVLNRELDGKYAGGNVYDAVVLSVNKAMLTNTADSYNTNMIETGFSRSIIADQLRMLENMLATMSDEQKKKMFANIGLRPKGELREDYTNEVNRIGLGIGKMLESIERAEVVNQERLVNSAGSYYSGHLFQMGAGLVKIEAANTRAKPFPEIKVIKTMLKNKLSQDKKITQEEFGGKLDSASNYVFNLNDIVNSKTQVESKANIAQISKKPDGKLKVSNKLWGSLSGNDVVEIIGNYKVPEKINSQLWHYNNILDKLVKSDAGIVTDQDLSSEGRQLIDGVWVKEPEVYAPLVESTNKDKNKLYADTMLELFSNLSTAKVQKVNSILNRQMQLMAGSYNPVTNIIKILKNPSKDTVIRSIKRGLQINLEEKGLFTDKIIAQLHSLDMDKEFEKSAIEIIKELEGNTGQQTLLHEYIHSVTQNFMINNTEHEAVIRMNELYTIANRRKAKIVELTGDTSAYWANSVNEFVAEGLSNPDFILALANLEVVGMKKLGLFEHFIKTVVEMLGLKNNKENMYSLLLDSTLVMAYEQGNKSILEENKKQNGTMSASEIIKQALECAKG
jgi:hypothetical protein